ncbi:MAG: Gfo/Idh/MocA family oxidoreductase [Planctomycetes bacterium]|nr:Gfo/Idh/MocA family oxidoreductase [Planctomycetota bacterium]
MSVLRIGIVGAGGIAAKLHLPEMRTVDGAEVTMLGGRRKSRLETLCRKFGLPRGTQDYDELIADPDVDGVIVALPHPLHVEWGVKALAAGKHVYMQKPLSTSLAEADRFVAAAEGCLVGSPSLALRAGNQKRQRAARVTDAPPLTKGGPGGVLPTVLALPHVSRPVILAARQMIAAGKLGVISAAHARHSHGGPEVYYAGIQQILEEEPEDALWFFDAAKADVGALFDMGVYAIANLVATVGSVRAVTARLTTVAKPTSLEDTAALILDFEGGALGTVETGWCDAARTAEFSIHGTEGKLVCQMRAGTLHYARPGSKTDEDAAQLEEAVDLARLPNENSHQHWVTHIRAGTQPPLSNARTARHVTEVMLAALASSREGRTVEVTSRLA